MGQPSARSAGAAALDRLRHAQMGQYAFPIKAQFSNWIEEAQAWRTSAALLDQSLHMTDLYVEGPDVVRLLSDLSVNSYKTFGRNKAKQIICCNEDGYLIGDCVLFGLEDDRVNIVGRPCVPNWVQYHAETGDYDVTVERDERRLDAPTAARKTYRFEVQGPRAIEILKEANEGPPLTTKFFAMGEIRIAGCAARTLSHGMGGAEGLEIWGPVEDGPKVRARLLDVGHRFGIRPAGARAYSTAAAESGGSHRPCRPFTRAGLCRLIATGCLRRLLKMWPRSAGRSCPRTSRTITSRLGTWTISGSFVLTMTLSGGPPWRLCNTGPTAKR